jgi:hypothetical protein
VFDGRNEESFNQVKEIYLPRLYDRHSGDIRLEYRAAKLVLVCKFTMTYLWLYFYHRTITCFSFVLTIYTVLFCTNTVNKKDHVTDLSEIITKSSALATARGMLFYVVSSQDDGDDVFVAMVQDIVEKF